MTTSADPASQALARLAASLCEDAIFVLAACGAEHAAETLDAFAKRRAEAYASSMQGTPVPRMGDRFDAWVAEATRAIAPVAAPSWLPMADLLKAKVTLEVGARGLRSLFSSKPSDKDVQRVKRLGALAVRVMRAVYAADGALDAEEDRAIALLVGALGLSHEDATPLLDEAPIAPESLEVYGELEPDVARGIVHGAWLAAAWDAIDPREEETLAQVAHGAPVVLAKRHTLPPPARQTALAVAWAAALHEDPTLGRRALLRARFERAAQDMGGDATKARALVDRWVEETLAASASSMR